MYALDLRVAAGCHRRIILNQCGNIIVRHVRLCWVVEGNATISSSSWPADKPPVGPRLGADRVRHLHSSDGVVNEQVESGSGLAKPQEHHLASTH